jgi:hypothetical protein
MPPRRLFRSLLRHHPRATRAHWRSLKAKYGPFDGPTRAYAEAVTAMWWSFTQATMDLAELEAKRRQGRGRRPSVQAIERLRKRQGVAFQSYDAALRRLEELAATRKTPGLAEVIRQRHGGGGA